MGPKMPCLPQFRHNKTFSQNSCKNLENNNESQLREDRQSRRPKLIGTSSRAVGQIHHEKKYHLAFFMFQWQKTYC